MICFSAYFGKGIQLNFMGMFGYTSLLIGEGYKRRKVHHTGRTKVIDNH
jgi:hypothetical protein